MELKSKTTQAPKYRVESNRRCLSTGNGHVAWFKYIHVCSNAVTKAGDPGNSDIQWAHDGTLVGITIP